MASQIKANRGEVITCIELLIVKLAMSVNVGKNIEPHQAADISQSIYKKYYKLSIEEVALVLKKGRAGEFGKLYDRLDEMIIMDWFEKYDCGHERESLVQNARIEASKQDKEENETGINLLMNNPRIIDLANDLIMEKETEAQKQKKFNDFRLEYLKNKTNA